MMEFSVWNICRCFILHFVWNYDITSGVSLAGSNNTIPWGVKEKSPVQQQSQRGHAGHQLRFRALCCRMIWRTAIAFVLACTFQADQKLNAFDVLTLSFLLINNLPLNHMASPLCREGTGSVATPTCGFNYGLWRGESARQKQTYGSRTTNPRCFPFLCGDEGTARKQSVTWHQMHVCFWELLLVFKCFPLGKNHVAPFVHALNIKFIRGWLKFCVCAVPLQLLCRNDQWIATRPLENNGRAEHPSN